MKTLTYQKQIAVRGAYDVAVVGSGPAGLCAAVAAAEEGARVVLIERFGVLGGNLTIGHVSPILGAVKAVDEYAHTVTMENGTVIPMRHIREISGELFEGWTTE